MPPAPRDQNDMRWQVVGGNVHTKARRKRQASATQTGRWQDYLRADFRVKPIPPESSSAASSCRALVIFVPAGRAESVAPRLTAAIARPTRLGRSQAQASQAQQDAPRCGPILDERQRTRGPREPNADEREKADGSQCEKTPLGRRPFGRRPIRLPADRDHHPRQSRRFRHGRYLQAGRGRSRHRLPLLLP